MKASTHRFRVTKPSSIARVQFDAQNAVSIALRACTRCSRLKKRCNKNPPQCEMCEAAGHICSLSQLEISSPVSPTTATGDTPTSVPTTNVVATQDETRTPDSEVRSQLQVTATSPNMCDSVPYLAYVQAYFRHVHRAYPFLDKNLVLDMAKNFTSAHIWTEDADAMILSLVVSIGSTTLERAGKLRHGKTLSAVPYSKILSICLLRPSITGLRILTLVALYSLFDHEGISTWSIVGILTRQATILGLTRTATSPHRPVTLEEELQHRLFWSIFVLDRMLAVSVGHPVGLIDDNADVPQPAVTVEEFASQDRIEHASLLQLNRHIIQLRQLEQRILKMVHIKDQGKVSRMSSGDRHTISKQLRSSIDDWYSLGCLSCLPEADNIPIHNTITWLNARYYNLLILLYYPCQFNSHSKRDHPENLLLYARKYLNYNRILLETRQLPLNYITLNRLLPACLILLHCFGVMQPSSYAAIAETNSCIEILRAFPEGWKAARQAVHLMLEFLQLTRSHEAYSSAQLVNFALSNSVPLQTSTKTWLHKIEDDIASVIAKSLGPSSCYLYLEDWDNPESMTLRLAATSSPQNDTTPPSIDLTALGGNYDFDFL